MQESTRGRLATAARRRDFWTRGRLALGAALALSFSLPVFASAAEEKSAKEEPAKEEPAKEEPAKEA